MVVFFGTSGDFPVLTWLNNNIFQLLVAIILNNGNITQNNILVDFPETKEEIDSERIIIKIRIEGWLFLRLVSNLYRPG